MQIVIETFRNHGEPSANPVRVRPLPGQLARDYRVWCSVTQRESFPVGAMFRVIVTWVRPAEKEPYLRIAPGDCWEPLTSEEAQQFISVATKNGWLKPT